MTVPKPNLTRQQILEIRESLERTMRRLERSVKASGNGSASREIDQSSVGRLSRIEALQNQGLTQNLQERERTQFDEVMQALSRLDAGTYGVCTTCRAAIAHERLLVFPETRTCGECLNGH
jgi:DnaK suppressor protein